MEPQDEITVLKEKIKRYKDYLDRCICSRDINSDVGSNMIISIADDDGNVTTSYYCDYIKIKIDKTEKDIDNLELELKKLLSEKRKHDDPL